jgi:hypothetical protein
MEAAAIILARTLARLPIALLRKQRGGAQTESERQKSREHEPGDIKMSVRGPLPQPSAIACGDKLRVGGMLDLPHRTAQEISRKGQAQRQHRSGNDFARGGGHTNIMARAGRCVNCTFVARLRL